MEKEPTQVGEGKSEGKSLFSKTVRMEKQAPFLLAWAVPSSLPQKICARAEQGTKWSVQRQRQTKSFQAYKPTKTQINFNHQNHTRFPGLKLVLNQSFFLFFFLSFWSEFLSFNLFYWCIIFSTDPICIPLFFIPFSIHSFSTV